MNIILLIVLPLVLVVESVSYAFMVFMVGWRHIMHAAWPRRPAPARRPAARPPSSALRFFLAGERVSQSADAAHYFGGEMGDLNWST